MRRSMRHMLAVTSWAEIISEKDNLLQTLLKKKTLFLLKKHLTNALASWYRIQLFPNTTNQPEINNKETCGQCPAENSAQRTFLEDKEKKGRFESTVLNIFMCLAIAYELLIKITRFHCLSGFWQVQRAMKVLPKECGRDSSTYGCSSTIKWS